MITKTTEFSALGSHSIDVNECSNANGYIRLPGVEFSAYNATWVNSNTMTIVSYVEGDVTRTYCETPMEFASVLDRYASTL